MASMAGVVFPLRSIHSSRRPRASPGRYVSTPFLETEKEARPTLSTPRPSPTGTGSPVTFEGSRVEWLRDERLLADVQQVAGLGVQDA